MSKYGLLLACLHRQLLRNQLVSTMMLDSLILALLRVELEQQGALGQIVHRGGQGNRTLREKANAGWATGLAGGDGKRGDARRWA